MAKKPTKKELLLKLGYIEDNSEYKKYRDYSKYVSFCIKNEYIEISKRKFDNYIKKTLDSDSCRRFLELYKSGKTIGDAKDSQGLSLYEAIFIIQTATKKVKILGDWN